MLRTALRLSPNLVFPFLNNRNEFDHDNLVKTSQQNTITGFDRVKKMFSKNEFDEVSVELHTVVQSAISGAFIGACIGGFYFSRNAYIYFIENNQATIFKTTLEAKKKLQDYVTVAFAKGAYTWGWRLGTFTGLFSLISTTISVYRGDTSLIDYTTAGAITGGLYKANLGLAATFVGAGLGAVLSTFFGLCIISLLKITGVSMEDLRKALYSLKQAREEQMEQAIEKVAVIKNDDLTRHHDLFIAEKGEKKIEDI